MLRLAILLPLLLLLGACGGDDPAAPPADDGSLAGYDLIFEGIAGGQPLLFRSAADGSGQPLLLGSGLAGTRPRVNPGGGSLLYTGIVPATQTAGIMVYMLDQAMPFPLLDTTVEMRDAVVSPDARKVAFISMQDDGMGDVFLADWDPRGLASNLRNLTPPPLPGVTNEREPAWSPDGGTIAFASNRSGVTRIWLMAADGSGVRVLDTGEATAWAPAWSPDGQWLAFEYVTGAQASVRIGIARPDGTDFRDLGLGGTLGDPAWSPAGDALAVAANFDGERDVFVVSTSGRIMARVRRPGADANPVWMRRE